GPDNYTEAPRQPADDKPHTVSDWRVAPHYSNPAARDVGEYARRARAPQELSGARFICMSKWKTSTACLPRLWRRVQKWSTKCTTCNGAIASAGFQESWEHLGHRGRSGLPPVPAPNRTHAGEGCVSTERPRATRARAPSPAGGGLKRNRAAAFVII